MGKKKTDVEQTEDLEPGEQADLFPELDTSDPQQKKLLQAARKYARDKAQRDALLSTSKEKVEGSMAAVIALMHECKIDKFRHRGVEAELIRASEKAEVRIEDEDDDTGEKE